MSIAICTGLGDPAVRSDDPNVGIIRGVPAAHGEADLRMVAERELTTFRVSPWPFATAVVQVTCEGVPLPRRRFDDETEMRTALGDATRVVLSAELRSG